MGKYSEQNIKEFFTVLNEANIITVSCPCCMEQQSSFSRNVLDFDGEKVQFSFPVWDTEIL